MERETSRIITNCPFNASKVLFPYQELFPGKKRKKPANIF